jgi:phospholipid/cholesterol/gamma-HCH transport system ATP-binding protein
MADESIIEVRDLVVELKGNRVLNGVTLDVYRGEILGFVGASGAGKSVLTRTILGLLPKQQGRIDVFGVNLDEAGEMQRQEIERRWGILFQQGALFSSLTVGENVEFPIREYLDISDRACARLST